MLRVPIVASSAGSAALVSLKAMSWEVTVVPMLAPRITPTACCRVIRPALTNPISMTVVAEEDWTTAVTRVPVRQPTIRLDEMVQRTLFIFVPALIFRPSAIMFMPRMKIPSPPTV
jgi:hypothetical protein